MSSPIPINAPEALLNLLRYSQDATLLYTSNELHVGFVNDAMLRILNKSRKIEGRRLEDFAPEFAPYFPILKELWQTGEDLVLKDSPADIDFEGRLITTYFDIEYHPVKDEHGQTIAIINTAREVTDRMLAERLLKEKQATEQALINKLRSSNEEIIETQQQLRHINAELQNKIKQVSINEQLLNRFIMEAPAGLALMRGPDYVYTIHNSAYQAILPGRQLLGRSFFDAVSELKGTPIEQVLHDVYHKGITHSFSESLVPLSDYEGGPPIDRYFTFNYLPWLDDKGKIDGILNLAVEVTEAVNARKAVFDSIERFEIAIDAGNFGTTEVDLATGTMVCNNRFKELFGIGKNEQLTYADMFKAMLPQYREKVKALSLKAREEHSLYEATYEIKWPDGSIHWIEAHGRARYDEDGNAYKMVGILADVTNQKADEQRKNDFIGMVSHELKTPITSLNAYLQMLRDKAKRAGDTFTTNALDRSVAQVKKMTTMINGFLNVSRLESGQIHINLQKFDMARLVVETEEESIATITSHKVIFAPVIETFVLADKDKIGNVINNLISNAVKYSPNGSTINIACVTIGKNAQVNVSDQGVGISAKDIPKLFDRYYRTETAAKSSTSGFGIGLYLSAEIIDRHNGKIWVESELGKGSTFYFSIPLHP